MKRYLVVFAILACTESFAQCKIGKDSESRIREIRQTVHKINSDTNNLRIVVKDVTGESEEGGEVKIFYSKDKLSKAILTFYGETGKLVQKCYFLDSMILFLFERKYHYSVPIYIKNSKVSTVVESRYYFNERKLIMWIRGNEIMASALYKTKNTEIQNDLKIVFLNGQSNIKL